VQLARDDVHSVAVRACRGEVRALAQRTRCLAGPINHAHGTCSWDEWATEWVDVGYECVGDPLHANPSITDLFPGVDSDRYYSAPNFSASVRAVDDRGGLFVVDDSITARLETTPRVPSAAEVADFKASCLPARLHGFNIEEGDAWYVRRAGLRRADVTQVDAGDASTDQHRAKPPVSSVLEAAGFAVPGFTDAMPSPTAAPCAVGDIRLRFTVSRASGKEGEPGTYISVLARSRLLDGCKYPVYFSEREDSEGVEQQHDVPEASRGASGGHGGHIALGSNTRQELITRASASAAAAPIDANKYEKIRMIFAALLTIFTLAAVLLLIARRFGGEAPLLPLVPGGADCEPACAMCSHGIAAVVRVENV
jgi:hypothetical protein